MNIKMALPERKDMIDQTDKLLTITDLRTYFHTVDGLSKAVDGLNLEIAHGETLGLVGESGSGKSVTALSILRLLPSPPAEIQGSIQFEGSEILDLDNTQLRMIRGNAITMIFQEPMTSFNPTLTIGRQITDVIRLHQGLSRQDAWELAIRFLNRVQMPEAERRMKSYPYQLSGGMRQRAMIAMALSCNPKLLLADEPTTALDVTIQAQIMDLITRLKQELKTSILLITHDLGLVAEMATRVAVMYAGKIAEEAPVKELFEDPRHPYTQGLLRSIPVIGRRSDTHRKLNEIPGTVPSASRLPAGCYFHPRCAHKLPQCSEQSPPMLQIGPGRRVSCWLVTNGIG